MSDQSFLNGELRPGAEVDVVKLGPDGEESARYGAVLVECQPDWIVVRATWTFPRMEFDYMTFEPEDYLLEYFSTTEPFNAFILFSPEDEFKGWYCNITYPTTVENNTIYWHDLYLDVVQKADGTILVLDEDELAEARLEQHDPDLHSMITSARDSVVEKMRNRDYPFSEFATPDA